MLSGRKPNNRIHPSRSVAETLPGSTSLRRPAPSHGSGSAGRRIDDPTPPPFRARSDAVAIELVADDPVWRLHAAEG